MPSDLSLWERCSSMLGQLKLILSALIQFQRRVLAALVDRGAPDLVRGLVLGAAVAERRAEAEIDVAHRLEIVDQLLGVEVYPGLPDRLDQHIGGDVALQRDIIGRLARE